ncbi:MAG TPA: ATP-binding protein [Cellulomonas sp.]
MLVPVLLVVALVATLGSGGLGRARTAQDVQALGTTAAQPSVDAAAAVSAELAATTGGADVAAARAATDTAVASFVDAARALDDDRGSELTATLLDAALRLSTDVATARDGVDGGQEAATTVQGYLAGVDSAVTWPLEVVRSGDPGPSTGAAVVTLVDSTRSLAEATVRTGSASDAQRSDAGAAAASLADTAAASVTRELGLAAAALVAVLLAGVCAWLAHRGRASATDDDAPEAGSGRAPRSARSSGSVPVAERVTSPAAPVAVPVLAAAVPSPSVPVAAPVIAAPATVTPVPVVAGARTDDGASAAALASARRDLTLLNRQLATLDALEQTEQDPAVLADLFELDNLTVRMRRNAESLLVLAGSDHGRRAREVAPVADALRAAASQIERYDRVRIDLEHDPFLHASHVVPVAHLFAELLENAATLSEPSTVVRVAGACDADAMTLQVQDQGVGMSAAELDAANAQLSAAGDVRDGRIGLRVVARLAERLGAQVRLERSPDGVGTVAVVRLPRVLFVEDDGASTASAAPAGAVDAAGPVAMTSMPALPPAALVAQPDAGPVFEPAHPVGADGGPGAGGPLPRRLPAPGLELAPVVQAPVAAPTTAPAATVGGFLPAPVPAPAAAPAEPGAGGASEPGAAPLAFASAPTPAAPTGPSAGTSAPGTGWLAAAAAPSAPDLAGPAGEALPSFDAIMAAAAPGTPGDEQDAAAPARARGRRGFGRRSRRTGESEAPAPVAETGAGAWSTVPAPSGELRPEPQAAAFPVASGATSVTVSGGFAPAVDGTGPTGPTGPFTPTSGGGGLVGAGGGFLPAVAPAAPVGTFAPGTSEVPGVPASAGTPAPASASAGTFLPPPGGPAAPGAAGGDSVPTQPDRAAGAGAPADSFTPSGTFTPGGGAGGWSGSGAETEASVRAAAQKVAMAELSGLTSYRPSANGGGGALPPRSPGSVASPPDDPTAQPVDRDAEELRRRLSAFQAGTARGRDGVTTPLGQ